MRIRGLNIVYFEDFDADKWEPLPEQPNVFNDVRCLVRDDGNVILSCIATTEPGRHYTHKRMNPLGAPRGKTNKQYPETWQEGMHFKQYALVQCADMVVVRDDNEDFIRIGDKEDKGIFGINQHTCGNHASVMPPPKNDIGKHSAGCWVGWHPATHYNKFMPAIKAAGYKRWDSTLLAGDRFYDFLKSRL